MVGAAVLNTASFGSAGSSPAPGTTFCGDVAQSEESADLLNRGLRVRVPPSSPKLSLFHHPDGVWADAHAKRRVT